MLQNHCMMFPRSIRKRRSVDTFPRKRDFGVGVRRDDNSKPWVPPVIKGRAISVRTISGTGANHGFASGDLDDDAWAVRYIVEKDMPTLHSESSALNESFTKNAGLYDERVWALYIIPPTKDAGDRFIGFTAE
ncbi:hypothetical protein DFH29DRAFT_872662 [Suillus ampliporus]|nr:hypothetical protein DFH29DRAFT_872662 [Suillus ampliporus]